MSKSIPGLGWVFYKMTIHGKTHQVNAVCDQAEWDDLEARRPGYHTLIRSGITSEAEAEKLARGTSGDQLNSRARLKRS